MKRLILLNNEQFPQVFNKINVIPAKGISKSSFVEQKIISAVNRYNPKLGVEGIEYTNIEIFFSNYKRGKSNGVLIEDFEIDDSLADLYIRNGAYIYKNGTKLICRRIMMYLFISGAEENTRTAFISQTIFPALLDYTKDYINSPSYSFANYNFLFINILNKKITANMILRHLASFCAIGMDYIEIFDNQTIVPKLIPLELKEFLRVYATDFSSKYDDIRNIYEDDNYKIEFTNKQFYWKANAMAGKLIEKNNRLDFKGSAEKFYWIETLPMGILAYNQGYKIDYSEYESFIQNYSARFLSTSEKFKRCRVLLEYIEKYFI